MPELRGVKYCKPHKFVTYSDIEFSIHLQQYQHYAVGDKTSCANCGDKIDGFLVPLNTLATPIKILCDNCKQKLNIGLDTIGYKKGDNINELIRRSDK